MSGRRAKKIRPWRAFRDALRSTPMSQRAHHVGVTLLTWMKDDGRVFCRQDRLAREMKVSVDTVQRGIRELLRLGLLVQTRHSAPNWANEYSVGPAAIARAATSAAQHTAPLRSVHTATSPEHTAPVRPQEQGLQEQVRNETTLGLAARAARSRAIFEVFEKELDGGPRSLPAWRRNAEELASMGLQAEQVRGAIWELEDLGQPDTVSALMKHLHLLLVRAQKRKAGEEFRWDDGISPEAWEVPTEEDTQALVDRAIGKGMPPHLGQQASDESPDELKGVEVHDRA